jgi:hypothetical protein
LAATKIFAIVFNGCLAGMAISGYFVLEKFNQTAALRTFDIEN